MERGTPALTVQAGRMSRPVLERIGFECLTLHVSSGSHVRTWTRTARLWPPLLCLSRRHARRTGRAGRVFAHHRDSFIGRRREVSPAFCIARGSGYVRQRNLEGNRTARVATVA